jgi:hypothetical protein
MIKKLLSMREGFGVGCISGFHRCNNALPLEAVQKIIFESIKPNIILCFAPPLYVACNYSILSPSPNPTSKATTKPSTAAKPSLLGRSHNPPIVSLKVGCTLVCKVAFRKKSQKKWNGRQPLVVFLHLGCKYC